MRTTRALLVAVALLSPLPALAAGAGRQLILEASLDSIDPLEDALELLETEYEPGERVDPVTEGVISGLLDLALTNTNLLLDAIATEPELAGTPERDDALDFGESAVDQMLGADLLVDGTKPVKAGRLHDAIETARDLHVAMLTAVQGRGDRFGTGRRFGSEVREHWGTLGLLLGYLSVRGVPYDRTARLESFGMRGSVAKLLERARFAEDVGVRVDFKNGVLGLRGAGKQPTTAGVRYALALGGQLTLLVSLALPGKLGPKQLEALTGFSAGVYLASDGGATPASSFLVEHQVTPQGIAQSFVAQGSNIVATFPLGAANLERRIRTVVVKDGTSIRLGLIQSDGGVETLHEVEVPFTGDLPFLSLYVRNATKKTRVEFDDLLIFAEPHVISLEE